MASIFQVDITEITSALNKMDQIPNYILQAAARQIEERGRVLLESVFEEAFALQSSDGFPAEFRDHVRGVVGGLPFELFTGAGLFEIGLDFNLLGTRQDLERAFHQGARLADGSILDGPYEGQELNEPDAATRHIYWEAVQKGLQSADNPHGPGRVPVKPGAWDETKKKYIQIWGDKAPEWLYLQFGQTSWEPEIQAYPIIEVFTSEFDAMASELLSQIVAEAIDEAQKAGTVLTPFGPRLAEPTGELGPSGKPRQPGQFYPRK